MCVCVFLSVSCSCVMCLYEGRGELMLSLRISDAGGVIKQCMVSVQCRYLESGTACFQKCNSQTKHPKTWIF